MDLALLDFDGTITRSDTFTPFIFFSASKVRVLVGSVLLGPMILGYKLGWISGSRMRSAIVRLAFWGRNPEQVRALGVEYSRTRLARTLRPEMLDRIRWHRERGDTVVIVSASLAVYLKPWCDDLGVEVIGNELEQNGRLLTGRYTNGDCSAQEKATRVRARYDLTRYPVIYAYGDSPEDRELLELAHERFFRGQPLGASIIAK